MDQTGIVAAAGDGCCLTGGCGINRDGISRAYRTELASTINDACTEGMESRCECCSCKRPAQAIGIHSGVAEQHAAVVDANAFTCRQCCCQRSPEHECGVITDSATGYESLNDADIILDIGNPSRNGWNRCVNRDNKGSSCGAEIASSIGDARNKGMTTGR